MSALYSSLDIFEISCHINRLDSGSMPAEGSSNKMILGLPIIAIAVESFLLFPPLS